MYPTRASKFNLPRSTNIDGMVKSYVWTLETRRHRHDMQKTEISKSISICVIFWNVAAIERTSALSDSCSKTIEISEGSVQSISYFSYRLISENKTHQACSAMEAHAKVTSPLCECIWIKFCLQ